MAPRWLDIRDHFAVIKETLVLDEVKIKALLLFNTFFLRIGSRRGVGGSCCQKRHLQNFFFFQKYCAPKHVRGLFALVLFSRHFFLIRGCLFFDVLSSLLSLARDRILMNYLEKGWTKCLRCSISKNKGPSFNKNDTYLASSQRPGKRTRVECASFGHQKPVFIPRITYRIFPSFKSSVLNAIERSHFLKRGVFFCFCFCVYWSRAIAFVMGKCTNMIGTRMGNRVSTKILSPWLVINVRFL